MTNRNELLRHRHGIRNELSLQKIAIASALLHLLCVSLIAVPLTSRQNEFRNYFVNIVGPIDAGDTETATPSGSESGTTQKSLPTGTDVSIESIEKVSREIERLRTIEKLAKIKSLREKIQSVQIVEKKGVEKNGQGIVRDTGSYYSVITQKIWQQWVYPDFKTSGLELTISIKIGRDGKIISQNIEKTSGNALFDRSAMKAILKASPFPPPPIEMEIGVRFYL
ncbi:MAG: TonB C-terminal domain-containing protein [Nitrospirae bacterium]|nr:TonB C-terminal domain-containing protein [Nitrospirota bacterium]